MLNDNYIKSEGRENYSKDLEKREYIQVVKPTVTYIKEEHPSFVEENAKEVSPREGASLLAKTAVNAATVGMMFGAVTGCVPQPGPAEVEQDSPEAPLILPTIEEEGEISGAGIKQEDFVEEVGFGPTQTGTVKENVVSTREVEETPTQEVSPTPTATEEPKYIQRNKESIEKFLNFTENVAGIEWYMPAYPQYKYETNGGMELLQIPLDENGEIDSERSIEVINLPDDFPLGVCSFSQLIASSGGTYGWVGFSDITLNDTSAVYAFLLKEGGNYNYNADSKAESGEEIKIVDTISKLSEYPPERLQTLITDFEQLSQYQEENGPFSLKAVPLDNIFGAEENSILVNMLKQFGRNPESEGNIFYPPVKGFIHAEVVIDNNFLIIVLSNKEEFSENDVREKIEEGYTFWRSQPPVDQGMSDQMREAASRIYKIPATLPSP